MTHHTRKLTAPKPPAQKAVKLTIPGSVTPKTPAKFETVSYAYDFRSRNNLKRGAEQPER